MSVQESNSREVAEQNAGLRAIAGNVKLGANGLVPTNLAELMDFAQLMAKSGPMVGKAFRNNPGACVAITMQALAWNMNPFAVSQKAYVTGDNIGYEAQLVTAVINAHAPVVARPKFTFEGEGAKRRCTVTATLKGETEPCVYLSPEVGTITTKNSPLWKQDPDQQLSYFSIRAWARRFCPEVIMGVYTVDELAASDATVVGNEPITEPLPFDDTANDPITEDQVAALLALAEEVGADVPRFCKLINVESIPEIVQSGYQAALDLLNAKRAMS